MAKLTWDNVGQRFFETGVSNGVLYLPDAQGNYINGVAWNGLTSVTEAPSGAEANPQYADNIKYLNLFSAEEFTATVEAFTYPDEFAQFDGLGVPEAGITIGQQSRKTFGLSYTTVVGNDLEGNDYGRKLHLVYGCQASPSEKSYSTINDSPEAITFSWSVTTTPVPVTGFKPTSIMTIDSTKVDGDTLAALELILYGDTAVDPELPQPDTIIALFSGTVTTITAINPPTQSGNNVTIPTTTGVTYYIDGEAVPAGVVAITEDTLVTANPNSGYIFAAGLDDDWLFLHT
jgi:hypothetical protein